jgi:hypothetical protein
MVVDLAASLATSCRGYRATYVAWRHGHQPGGIVVDEIVRMQGPVAGELVASTWRHRCRQDSEDAGPRRRLAVGIMVDELVTCEAVVD